MTISHAWYESSHCLSHHMQKLYLCGQKTKINEKNYGYPQHENLHRKLFIHRDQTRVNSISPQF